MDLWKIKLVWLKRYSLNSLAQVILHNFKNSLSNELPHFIVIPSNPTRIYSEVTEFL